LLGLGRATLAAGAAQQAHSVLVEALARWRELGLRVGLVRTLAGLAGVAAAQGELERATRLYAAAADAVDDGELAP